MQHEASTDAADCDAPGAAVLSAAGMRPRRASFGSTNGVGDATAMPPAKRPCVVATKAKKQHSPSPRPPPPQQNGVLKRHSVSPKRHQMQANGGLDTDEHLIQASKFIV